ncbi:S-layer homology domain-containing protein [Paenibacillus antibioticophila]|uniref:S-layer homology domain-containing protein n=1 Tax=Paenibacillus antibioticophila TaxID=1274374 RepID=UPI0005C8755D|nr:S-layer homology domain-containing protein [Paenibacillus antibioticophila]
MRKYLAAMLALVIMLMPASVFAAASFTLDLSVKEVQRGGQLTLSGEVADESDDVVVKIVSPNQTILYIDVIPAASGAYSQTVTIPQTEDLAPAGQYTVVAGNGGLTASGTFTIPAKGSGTSPTPSPAPSPAPTAPANNNSSPVIDSDEIPPDAGQANGAKLQPELAKDGRYLVGRDVLAEAARQANGSVTIELPAAASESGAALEFPAKSLTELSDQGTDLIIVSGNRTVRFPAGALSLAADSSARIHIVVQAAWNNEAKAWVEQSLKNQSDYAATGVVLSVVIQLISGDSIQEIHQLDKPAVVTIALTSEQAQLISADLAGVYYADGASVEYVPGVLKNGQFTFSADHFSYYTILQYSKTFLDLVGHWAEASVKSLAAKQIVNGVDNNHYAPGRSITRAEFVALIMRALDHSGSQPTGQAAAGGFTDVPAGRYYTENVAEAAALGIITGYEGKFRPNDQITREEAVVALNRAADYFHLTASGQGQPAFTDAGSISDWAKEAVETAWSHGLIQGDGKKFNPGQAVTRAEVAVMVERLLKSSSL